MAATLHAARRSMPSSLLSLTYPNKELFHRQHALLRGAVSAGLPAPADDEVQQRISLDEHLVEHRESTFFMRVAGDSMRGMGIFDGDLLVVDRAMPAAHGAVVIAVLEGEFTVKQLLYTASGKVLRAAHPDYPDLPIRPEQDFAIWGVVRWNVHKVTNPT
jgi:DNA polymerase V